MISEDYDHRWEALAEVHFDGDDDISDENYIYCLCSRVFIRYTLVSLTYLIPFESYSRRNFMKTFFTQGWSKTLHGGKRGR